MNDRIEGKTALVTGGSRGIGAAVAQALAAQGADVAFTYQSNTDEAANVVDQIKALGRRALAIQADFTDPEAVAAAVDEAAGTFGRLDILVNNAGLFLVNPLEELDQETIDRTIAVNVRAPLAASQAAVRHMREGDRIISIGSNVAERAVFPGLALYMMSKTAMTGMTKGLARELGSRGITVNLVHPGPTDTASNPADGPAAGVIAGFTAVGRYAQASEIAGTVAFLAGPEAQYVTGASIAVDGGFTA